jgi:hypothetical protein
MDTAYFIGEGRFPNAAPVELDWSKAGTSGKVTSVAAADPQYCTYNVRLQPRWLGADGQEQPAPATTKGMVITLESALERIACNWVSGAIDCTQRALPSSPLPPKTYRVARRELQVPAFSVNGRTPAYTVTITPPVGYRVAGGSGSFVLPDLGAGLGQANADDRLASFLDGTGHLRYAPITFQVDAPAPTTTAPPPTTAPTSAPTSTPTSVRPGVPQQPTSVAPPTTVRSAPTTARPARPTAPARPTDPTTAALPLPHTGPVNPAVVAGGVAALATGLGILLLTTVRRRRV